MAVKTTVVVVCCEAVNWIHLARVVGCCEDGNGPSGTSKVGKCFDLLSDYQLLRKGCYAWLEEAPHPYVSGI
jgi:hypothetical protein